MSSNKTVLITGATRGIGLALVEQYVKNGWRVITTARNVDKAGPLKALSPSKIVQLDAGDEDSIARAAEALEGEPIDLLINNAAIGIAGGIEDSTKDAFMQQFEINSVGPFLVTRALLSNLKQAAAANGSAIVAHLSSSVASISDNNVGGMYGYRASKTALNMINSSLAVDLKTDKIIAVVLDPGYVNTDMNNHSGPLSPSDSAAGMSSVIAGLKMADTGKFFEYTGASKSW